MLNLTKRHAVRVLVLLLPTTLILILLMFKPTEDLESALELAGGNRSELEKVISHYRANGDSLKLEAAIFLLKNLPGHFARDTSVLRVYRPILFMYDSLINERMEADSVDKLIGRPWKELKDKAIGVFNVNLEEDVKTISSAYLIANIEQSFRVWQNNPYSENIPFSDFCEYILPYRRQSGLAIENWRSEFMDLHFEHLVEMHPAPLQVVMDTLLLHYDDYKHSIINTSIPDFPYLKLSDFRISKRAECETKCWFNSMLFSSIGIPVTIDYVPFWGARNGGHYWNALILDNKTYPFESFWEDDKWRYKELYNNQSSYEYGVVRLPKVFRYTFSTNKESPVLNPKISPNDIPPLLRNTKFKDVSGQYFSTTDVELSLENRPSDAHYAYLCVSYRGQWEPVQWAQIEGNTAVFPSMGRDIVYLPAYYKKGKVIPAGDAFLLDEKGLIHGHKPSSDTKDVVIKRKYPLFPIKLGWAKALVGGRFQAANNPSFLNAKDLFLVQEAPDPYFKIHKVENDRKFRYVRFLFDQTDYGNLSEIAFFKTEGDTVLSVKGSLLVSREFSESVAAKALDGNLNNYVPLLRKKEQTSSLTWIGLDLGKPQEISAVGICPRNDGNNIFPGLAYELLYWNGSWKSLGSKVANTNELIYRNAPLNAIFLLRCLDGGKEERIFVMDDNDQIWR